MGGVTVDRLAAAALAPGVDQLHLVPAEHPVGGDQHQRFQLCLCDEHSIERVAVMLRQLGCMLGVSRRDVERTHIRVEPSRRLPAVILNGMTHIVGPKGQVVVPKKLREELGIEPGDEVTFLRDEDHVVVRPVGNTHSLRGRFSGSSLTDDLIADRSADREREDRRDRRP